MAENRDCNSAEGNPKHSLYYLSCELRLLAEVSAHVKRCRKCYAVEEESEGLAGGWAIGTPKGPCRSSIVTHPLYLDLTSKSCYYCISCFRQCFGARVPAASEDVQVVLEEKGETSAERSKLVTVSKVWLADLKEFEVADEMEVAEEEAYVKEKEVEIDGGVRKRKKKSESTEKGGRCSRINGRGWQCKKITIAGYALCEYHLALARSRTMASKLS